MTVRVVVADDQPLLRAGLRGIIDTAPDLTVVAEAGTGREAIAAVERHRPDLILMDIRMPDGDGIQATAAITASSHTRVLILTTFDLDEYVYAALRAGASGFLLKDAAPADLLDGLRIIAAGDAILAPGVTRRLIAEFAASHAARPAASSGGDPSSSERAAILSAISDRELEVLQLVAGGLSNAEIAARLHISHGTTKTHIAHLLTKLEARDRIQLVIIAHHCELAAMHQQAPP
ncbi:MAG: response regulator transcription factor [Actinomycetota bacterium]|nr:response regulator transcription factor [Actinomycetota bacterium]MDQ2956327.1 response regulator transcription factor [Actinomycetota bacterium]